MKIALIMENSQASKYEIVYNTLKNTVESLGHTVDNYGMFSGEDKSLTYVQNGLLAGILLNSGAADFVVTGCGTGMGAMLALNSFPNVSCGLIIDPTDAFLFGQINDGNAISLPYAKGFGWAAEVNLAYIFEKLFTGERGLGYPRERAVPMKANREILKNVKKITHTPMIDVLKNIDREFLLQTIDRPSFKELFFANAKCPEIIDFVKSVLN